MYVDDLDKCTINKIVEVIDAIQLMLTEHKAPYVVLMSFNSQIITDAIDNHFRITYGDNHQISGQEKLDQLINLPFCLPNKNILTQFNMLNTITKENTTKFLVYFTVDKIKNFVNNKFKNRLMDNLLKKENNEDIINTFYDILYKDHKIDFTSDFGNKCVKINDFIEEQENSVNYNNVSRIKSNETNKLVKTVKLIKTIKLMKTIKSTSTLRFNEEIIEDNLKKIEEFLNDTNISTDNLEEYFFRLNRMEEKMSESLLNKYKYRITKNKNLIRSKFYYFRNAISSTLFGGYSTEETDVFYNLSFFLGNSLNMHKTRKIINIYNLSRFILPKNLYDQKQKLIQFIIMSEFWNYRMTWYSLALDKKYTKDEEISEWVPSLISFYDSEVITMINKNYDKHNKFLQMDNPEEDFQKICSYENLRICDFYKLQQYIFNIDQCLKNRFLKFI